MAEETLNGYLSEIDRLLGEKPGESPATMDGASPEMPAATPAPSSSPTVQTMEQEGFFADLKKQREAQRAKAIEENVAASKEGLYDRFKESASEVWNKATTLDTYKPAAEAVADPQWWLELPKGIAPGAAQMVGTAVQALPAWAYAAQSGIAKFNYKQLETLDRVERGEKVSDADDPYGFQHMTPAQRLQARADIVELQEKFSPTPIQQRILTTVGETIQNWGKTLMPAAPGYEQSFSRQIGEGLGSMVPGVILPAITPGRLAPWAMRTFFGAGGGGEALQNAMEFDKKERAAGRPGLTDDVMAQAAILGIGPGMTDSLPIEHLLSASKAGKSVPAGFIPLIARFIARVGGQVFIEGTQEGGQQFLQNVISAQLYDENKNLLDEVGGNMLVGGAVGGVAQVGKEGVEQLVHRIAGRRGGRTQSSQTPADTTTPPLTDGPALPQAQPVMTPMGPVVMPTPVPQTAEATEAPPVAIPEFAPVEIPAAVPVEPPADAGSSAPKEAAAEPAAAATPDLSDPTALISQLQALIGQVSPEAADAMAQFAPAATPEAQIAQPAAETLPSAAQTIPDAVAPGQNDTGLQLAGMAMPSADEIKSAPIPDLLGKLDKGSLNKVANAVLARQGKTKQQTLQSLMARLTQAGFDGYRDVTAKANPFGNGQTTSAARAQASGLQGRAALEQRIRDAVAQISTPVQGFAPKTAAQIKPNAAAMQDVYGDKFAKLIAGNTPRSKWAQQLKVDEAVLQSLIDKAVADGFLRLDRNGRVARTAQSKYAVARRNATGGNPLALTPVERVGRALRAREEAGAKISDVVRHAASAIEEVIGTDRFKRVFTKATKKLSKPEALELARLVGYPQTGRSGKAEALASIQDRHKALQELSNAQPRDVRESAGSVSEGSLSGGVREDGGLGDAAETSAADRAGSGRNVLDAQGGNDEQSGAARDVRGAGEGVERGAGDGARDGQSRPDPRAAVAAYEPSPEDVARIAADAEKKAAEIAKAREARVASNYRISDKDDIGKGGPKAKVRANLEALRVLKAMEDEGRTIATPEEKAKLVKYVGWGAFAQDLFATYKTEWAKERAELQNLLTPEEYASAQRSTLNAHYTSPDVIKGMWKALERLGFKGGRALEPSAGIGHFIGLQPEGLAANTDWTAVELDAVSGRITKALYGAADVRIGGFEEQKWPNDHFDLAISNVPFGDYKVHDPAYNKHNLLIHDYFFVKSLDLVRPGGIVAFITSSGTLDKQRDAARREIEKRGTFLGAIRLPGGSQGAFKANAGTDVTTDIIFVRKRVEGEPVEAGAPWTTLAEIKTPEGPTSINGYFVQNPDMMLGKMRLLGSMYRANEPVLIGPSTDLDSKIEAAAQKLPEGAMTDRAGSAEEIEADNAIDTSVGYRVKEGAFYEKDGKLFRKVVGVGQPVKLNKTDEARVRAFLPIRDTVTAMLDKQASGTTEGMDDLRLELDAAYDAFVEAHGPINLTFKTVQNRKDGKVIEIKRQPNLSAFDEDPDAYTVSAIEVYDEATNTARKAAIFTEDIVAPYQRPEIAGPADALAVSLNETGGVDLKRIAEMLKTSEDRAAEVLGDAIYKNPRGEKWQTAAKYLSGDVVAKLEEAKIAAALPDGKAYERNVAALEAVQPKPLSRAEITVPFGASWVPAEVINQFLAERVGARGMKVDLNPETKQWRVIGQGAYSQAAQAEWGTDRKSVAEIVEAALNSAPVMVYNKLSDGSRVRDDKEEAKARAKVELLREAFTGQIFPGAPAAIGGWVWQDEQRASELEALYNASFNRIVKEEFDGSHLTFPGLAQVVTFPDGTTGKINLTPARTGAIWRIIQNGNTLIDHVVGAGKTWTSIMAVMEMKRLGQIRRPMFVVPNHMLHQFSNEFLQAYPNAKLLVATKDQMSAAKRREFAAKAAAEKWDGIIITHSAFGRLRMKDAAYKEFFEEQIEKLENAKEQAAREDGKGSPRIKDLEKAKKRLEARLEKLTNKEAKDTGVTFEELGVDHLTVDEAHLFKNLWFPTRHTRVKGISNSSESQRATDLYIKIRHLEKSRPGRSALFLTGTPLSNTMAEVYTMMRYLQHDTLAEYGIAEFDSWAQTFGEIKTKTELAPNGRDFRDTTSFGSFVNIPELSTLYGKIADTQTAESLKLPRPKLKGEKAQIVESELSREEDQFVSNLIKEMEKLKGQKPEKGAPNFLSLFTKGLQVGTDMRLVDPSAPRNPDGKIAKTIANVARIWEEGNADPAAPNKTQLIFLDMGVPGSKAGKPLLSATAKPATLAEWTAAMGKEDEASIEAIRKKLADEAVDEDGEPTETKDEDDAIAEAMLVGKFNLYEDIKQGLIEKGVPANQIAFIHDAKNDEQKAKLFQAVREGKIRVLIGSSSKMGVGTNVQKRLVALHHVDAPWKPADVEQRDGRILRQGNMNPEVQIFRYITKRSFDSYRWQILENKSHFIGQFRAGARGVRIAEDIDAPLPDAAELKAAATGDPRIVEHAELTREVRVLDAQNSAHAGAAVRARQMLGATKARIETNKKYLANYEADAAKVEDLRGENFKVQLTLGASKREMVDRKAAGELVKKSLLIMAERAGYYGGQRFTIGTLSGFTMNGFLRRTADAIEVEASIQGTEEYKAPRTFVLNEQTPPAGLIQRWERLVNEVPRIADSLKGTIASLEAEIPKLEKASVGSEFPKAAELAEKRKRLAELTEVLDPAKAVEAAKRRAEAEGEQSYVDQAMRNLTQTSRTASGVVDTSASAGKAEKMAEGLTADSAKKAANENFERVIRDLFRGREEIMALDPNALADKVDQIALEINKGILKDGALYRGDDSPKYAYTLAEQIPEARDQFAAELWERLHDTSADPVETAAWIEWRMNLTDHIYADGVGKTSKAVAYIPLMRAGLPLPNYGTDKKAMFKYASDHRYDPAEGGESYLDDKWAAFLAYYRSLIPTAEGSPEAQRRDTMADAEANKRELSIEEMEEIGNAAFESQKYMDAVRAAEAQTPTVTEEFLKTASAPEMAAWKESRTYTHNGETFQGYEAGVELTMAKAMDYAGGPTAMRNERKAVVLLGLPGSGKSTISSGFAVQEGAAVLNGDDTKEFIPQFANGLGSIAVHEEASEITKDAMRDFLRSGTNLVLEKTGSNPDSIKKIVNQLRAHDYGVQLVLVDVPKALAKYQVVQRFEKKGRIVPPAYLQGLKTDEVYYTLEKERAADGFTHVERKTPEGAWVIRTLAQPFQNRDIESTIERTSGGLARVVRYGGRAGGQEAGRGGSGYDAGATGGADAQPNGARQGAGGPLQDGAGPGSVELGPDVSPALATPKSDDELRALIRKELLDAGRAEPGREDAGSGVAGAEGGASGTGGPVADRAVAGGQADLGRIAREPGPVRNSVLDRYFDEHLNPAIVEARAEAQGFTTKGWHGTKAKPFEVVDPFRFGRDLGFHFAIVSPDAANERLEYATPGKAFSWESPAKKLAAKLGLYAPQVPASSRWGRDNVAPLRVRVKNPLRAPDVNQWNNPTRWQTALNNAATAKQFASPGVVRELRNFVQGWLRENRAAYSLEALGSDAIDFLYHDFGLALTRKLTEMGYDGIIYRNASEAVGSDSMMVWNPAQVRSANDAFDPRAEGLPGLFASKPFIDEDVRARIEELLSESEIGAQSAALAMGYTPRFMQARATIAREIIREAERVLPPQIAVRVADRLTVMGRDANGGFDSTKGIVHIATSQGMRSAIRTLFHEAQHALRGLYTTAEWQILTERARKLGDAPGLANNMQAYRDLYATRGRTLKGLSGPALEDYIADSLDEERVAMMAESYAEGVRYGREVDTLLDRIVKFIEAVRNAFRGLGFQTADDIFAKAMSGEIAQRATPQEIVAAAEKLFTPELPSQESFANSPAGQALMDAMAALNAWHGSRHNVDQFKLEKVGTGEGAQAYSWGLYFAQAEGVAKYYKRAGLKNLPWASQDAEDRVAKHGGDVDAAIREIAEEMRGEPKYRFESFSHEDGRSTYFRTEQEAMDDAETRLEKTLRSPAYKGWKMSRDVSENTTKFIASTGSRKYRTSVVLGGIARSVRPEWASLNRIRNELENWGNYRHDNTDGNLYQVKLNVERDELLDWYKYLKAQPENLQKLGRFVTENKPKDKRVWGWRRITQQVDAPARVAQELDGVELGEMTGEDLYRAISHALYVRSADTRSNPDYRSDMFDKAASELLRAMGIKGVTYLDAMSRGKEQGQTYNIVIFDDRDVEITHKNGEPIKKEDVADAMADIADDVDAGMASAAFSDTTDFMLPGYEGEVTTDMADDGSHVRTITVGTAADPLASVVLTQTPEGAWEASGFHLADGADPTLLAQILDAAAMNLGRPLAPTGILSPNQAAVYLQTAPQALGMHRPVGDAALGVIASPKVFATQVAAQQELGAVSASLSTQQPQAAPPATTTTGAQPAAAGPSDTIPQALDKIIEDLKTGLGMPVTPGLGGLRVHDRANRRSWFFRPKKNLRGQYQSNMQAARIKVASDIEAIAHEGGHHMEQLLGARLTQLLNQHKNELAAYGAAVRTNANALSEGFAEWFADYITNPAKAEQMAPQFHAAFEDLVDAERPGLLAHIDSVQLVVTSKAYQDYVRADETNQMLADLASHAPKGLIKRIGQRVQYVRDQASEIGYRKAIQQSFLEAIGQDGTISGMASQLYTGGVDENHPHYLLVQRLLQVADRNKMVDASGRAISLKVHENPYKLLRSVGDAFKTGLRWMQDGMPNYRHMDAGYQVVMPDGRIIKQTTNMEEALAAKKAAGPGATIKDVKGHRSASLHDALTKAMGPRWNEKALALFNSYLVSRRAVEEWKTWEAKQARIVTLTGGMKQAQATMTLARQQLAKMRAMMARAQDQTTAGDALLAEFNSELQRLINKEAADVAIMNDPATTDQQYENARQRLKITRRELNRIEAKYQDRAARVSASYAKQFTLQPQMEALKGGIEMAEEGIAQIRKELKTLSEKGIQRAPTRHSRQAHERNIAKIEAANPQFKDAAQMVYDFVWQSAVHDYQAGRLSKEELDYRATRKHFYVPFARSIPELEQDGVLATGRGFGGRSPKFAKDKAFTGSQRSVYNPIETIMDQAFHRAAATHLNEAIRAYVALADRAGPGAAALGERVVQNHLVEANDQAFRNLEQSLMALGHSENDAKELVRRIEADFGDTNLLLQFDTTAVGPAKPLNITFWENGERKYFRINDPQFAQTIHNAVNGIGRELSNVFIDSLAAPATLLRVGVTTNPTFILRNVIRDAMTSWLTTGSILDPRTWPVVTQVRGLYHEVFQTEMAKMYQEVGGLMGGQNVAALPKVKDKADAMALKDRGLQVSFPAMAAAGMMGAGVGFATLGPAGAAFGAMVGIATHKGHPKTWLKTLAHLSDMSETATRLGTFTQAYRAALAYDPTLTPFQAAQEAAFVARDLIDFGRHGSVMMTAARLTPFMNANIQGMDKTIRVLLGRSDRGNQVSTPKLIALMGAGMVAGTVGSGVAVGAGAAFGTAAAAVALGSRVAAARALISPMFKETHGIPLSADDRKALGQSAKTWAALMLLTLGGVALAATYGGAGGDGEDEYKLIREKFKYKAMPVKDPFSGEWYAIPKPFEWALPMNIIEAGIEAQYRGDPRFWEKVRENLVEVGLPPMAPQLLRLYADVRGNYNSLSKRPIVPDYLLSSRPEERFNAYASEFAIWLSRSVNQNPKAKSAVEGVGSFVFQNKFELTPAIVDYAISQSMGYWGKDAQKASDLAFRLSRGEEPRSEKVQSLPLIGTMVQSFKIDPYRISDALDGFYEVAGRAGGTYAMAAKSYKDDVKRYGPDVANAYLARLPEDERAYALLEASAPKVIRDTHPLNRLKEVVKATGDIERETLMGRLANTSNPVSPERIKLSPAKSDEVRDLMAKLKTIEIQNTLSALGVKQFAGRKQIDVEPTLKVLEASSPEVAAELRRRYMRAKVRDFQSSVESWNERKGQLLQNWQEAVDQHKALVKPSGRRAKPVVPYEGMPGTWGKSE